MRMFSRRWATDDGIPKQRPGSTDDEGIQRYHRDRYRRNKRAGLHHAVVKGGCLSDGTFTAVFCKICRSENWEGMRDMMSWIAWNVVTPGISVLPRSLLLTESKPEKWVKGDEINVNYPVKRQRDDQLWWQGKSFHHQLPWM